MRCEKNVSTALLVESTSAHQKHKVVSMSQPPIGDYGSSSSTAAASPLLPAVPSGDGMPQQQQQQPIPGAHDANHGGSAKMNQLLDANYLGVHTLAVGQVKSTELTWQINARGLNKVKLSIKTKGWVNSNTPYVLVPREQLPSGKDTVFSTELLGTLTIYCLDGNHRIQALLELEGAEFSVDCRLYLHFDCAETIKALARSEYTYRIFVSSCRYVLDLVRLVCVLFVCVFFPFMLDIKFVGRTSRGHTGGRSHRIYHPPFCGARLNLYIFCTTTSSSSRL